MENHRPLVYLDGEIVVIDFHEILITEESMTVAAKLHHKLTGDIQSKVIVIGQSALDVNGKLREVTSSPFITEITSAVAIIPTTKVGHVLASIFLSVIKNPYPTKSFTNIEDAKNWLTSL